MWGALALSLVVLLQKCTGVNNNDIQFLQVPIHLLLRILSVLNCFGPRCTMCQNSLDMSLQSHLRSDLRYDSFLCLCLVLFSSFHVFLL